MPKTKGLTLKQQRFIVAYFGEAKGNGVKAARIAGYKGNDRTLSVVASENLAKPDIAREIGSRAATVMTSETVLKELSKIAGTECCEPVRVADKIKALDLMGRYHQVFNESVKVTVEQIERNEVAIILRSVLSDAIEHNLDPNLLRVDQK